MMTIFERCPVSEQAMIRRTDGFHHAIGPIPETLDYVQVHYYVGKVINAYQSRFADPERWP
jgi:hypothetical protein